MTNRPGRGVQTLDIVQGRLNQLHAVDGLSWRKIAARGAYKGIPFGTLAAIAAGRDPQKAEHRRILGLPIPIEKRTCLAKRRCNGNRFNPNVPWRYSCYDCSPMRRTK